MPEANTRAVPGHNQPPTLEQEIKERHPKIFEDHKSMERRLKLAVSKLTDAPPVTEDDCNKLTVLVADANDVINEADKIRVKEKEPFQIGATTVDGLFNKGIRDVLGPLRDQLNRAAAKRRAEIAEAAQRAAAAEAEKLATAAAKKEEEAKAAEEAGDTRKADQKLAQADAGFDAAARAQATAGASLGDATRTQIGTGGGAVRAAVSAAMVCKSVIKADLDLEALRPFLKDTDLIDAVNRLLKAGNAAPKGAVCERDYTQRVGRR